MCGDFLCLSVVQTIWGLANVFIFTSIVIFSISYAQKVSLRLHSVLSDSSSNLNILEFGAHAVSASYK